MLFYFCFLFSTIIASPNLFDHAIRNYVTHISNQSPEKAKIAELITRAADVIKNSDQENQKQDSDTQDNADVECDEKTFDELRLICAKNGAPFLEKINPKTAAGMTYLIKYFTTPTTDNEVLKKRQVIIDLLAKNPEFLQLLEEKISELKNEESNINIPEIIEPRYTFLEKASMYLKKLNLLSLIFSIASTYTLEEQLRVQLAGGLIESQFTPQSFSSKLLSFNKYPSMIKAIITFKNDLHWWPQTFGLLLICSNYRILILNILETINTIPKLFINYQKNHRSYKTLLLIHEQILQNKQLFPQRLYTDKNVTNLTTQLKKSTYKGTHTSYFVNPYTVYRTEKMVQQNKKELKKIYYDIAQCDAYIALAQFYRKHNGQFAEYSNASHPTIEIKEAIHPNITDETKAIANDFLHTPSFEKQVIVCSGKNGSGKSFNTKTILLAAWLAQTVGFTLTKKPIAITPFSFFKIHANIADSDHYSKFETEKNELAKLFEKITSLEKNNKKSLVLFDEPLSTTSSTIAEPILNAFIAMLNNNKHTLSFIITHLHPILAHKNARQISIQVTKNDNGTFSSTRKFQEGPSYDNDAGQMITQALHPTLQSLFLNSYETALQKIKGKNNTIEEKNDDDAKRHSV